MTTHSSGTTPCSDTSVISETVLRKGVVQGDVVDGFRRWTHQREHQQIVDTDLGADGDAGERASDRVLVHTTSIGRGYGQEWSRFHTHAARKPERAKGLRHDTCGLRIAWRVTQS